MYCCCTNNRTPPTHPINVVVPAADQEVAEKVQVWRQPVMPLLIPAGQQTQAEQVIPALILADQQKRAVYSFQVSSLYKPAHSMPFASVVSAAYEPVNHLSVLEIRPKASIPVRGDAPARSKRYKFKIHRVVRKKIIFENIKRRNPEYPSAPFPLLDQVPMPPQAHTYWKIPEGQRENLTMVMVAKTLERVIVAIEKNAQS